MPKSSFWPPLYLHLAGFEYVPLFASVKSHCWSTNQVDRKLLEMHFWLIVEFFGPQALQTLQAGVKLHLRRRVHFLLNKKCTLFIDNTTPKIQKVAINTGSKRKRDVWKNIKLIYTFVFVIPQLVSEFLHDPRTHAPPQSFRMGDLLHEMKEIEQRNFHHTPVRGGLILINSLYWVWKL